MAENNGALSRRDQQLERLRKKYPEKKFEDDEEIYGQISDDYDQYEQDIDRYKKDEKALSDMFNADPRSAQFLADMHNGEDPVVGLVRRFGVEIRDAIDDPEMQEKIAAANKEYLERVAKSKQYDEEYTTNFDASLDTLNEYKESHGMADEEIDAVYAAMVEVVRDGVMGIFKPETIDMFVKALNHDMDVTTAGEEGRVAGRNEKIVEGLRKADKGDGTAPLSGKNSGPQAGQRHAPNIFDLAHEAM